MSRTGGLARAAALSPERRSEIARQAAKRRWEAPTMVDGQHDLYGEPPRFNRGQAVYKTGSGYSGPGKCYGAFLGDDLHWRYIVGHQIARGQGRFYHVYGAGQLRVSREDVEMEHGDVAAR